MSWIEIYIAIYDIIYRVYIMYLFRISLSSFYTLLFLYPFKIKNEINIIVYEIPWRGKRKDCRLWESIKYIYFLYYSSSFHTSLYSKKNGRKSNFLFHLRIFLLHLIQLKFNYLLDGKCSLLFSQFVVKFPLQHFLNSIMMMMIIVVFVENMLWY